VGNSSAGEEELIFTGKVRTRQLAIQGILPYFAVVMFLLQFLERNERNRLDQ
jgi:hypothetical protein